MSVKGGGAPRRALPAAIISRAAGKTGRRAKYYRLTPVGRRQLAREEAEWLRYVRVWYSIAAAAAPD